MVVSLQALAHHLATIQPFKLELRASVRTQRVASSLCSGASLSSVTAYTDCFDRFMSEAIPLSEFLAVCRWLFHHELHLCKLLLWKTLVRNLITVAIRLLQEMSAL
jgi:hypothetical protein